MYFIKKCLVLREMQDPIHDEKWLKLRVRNRFERKQIVKFGTKVQLQYGFSEI